MHVDIQNRKESKNLSYGKREKKEKTLMFFFSIEVL